MSMKNQVRNNHENSVMVVWTYNFTFLNQRKPIHIFLLKLSFVSHWDTGIRHIDNGHIFMLLILVFKTIRGE